MGRTRKTVNLLEFSDIVLINRRMIDKYGGFFEGDDNLLNPGSLEYVLDAIHGLLFETDPYPTVAEKAAALAWWIITRHVFHDGNKRTGMEACRMLLDLNGYTMRIDQEVVDVATHIAERELSFPQFVRWLEKTVEPRNHGCTTRLANVRSLPRRAYRAIRIRLGQSHLQNPDLGRRTLFGPRRAHSRRSRGAHREHYELADSVITAGNGRYCTFLGRAASHTRTCPSVAAANTPSRPSK